MNKNCLSCGKELSVTELRAPTSYARRKGMHRKCAKRAKIKVDRADEKQRKVKDSEA